MNEDADKGRLEPSKKVHQIEKAIEDSIENFNDAAESISNQVETKEQALQTEFNEANVSLAKVKQDLDANAENLQTNVNNSIQWIAQKIGELEVAGYTTAAIFAVIYVAAILYFSVVITLATLSPLLTALALSVMVGYSARRTKQQLTDDTLTIDKYLSSIFATISSTAGRRLKLHESFDGIDQGLNTALSQAKKVLSATKAFNPALKAMYDQASVEFQQGVFINTLANSLRSFGLEIGSDSLELLTSFTSLSNTEDEWLTDLSKQLAKNLDVSSAMICLFYYSYVANIEGTRNAWKKIRDDTRERSLLAKVLLSNGRSGYLDSSSPKVIELGARILQGQETFDAWAFYKAISNFQVKLRAFEESMVQALTRFGFNVNSLQQNALYDYVPKSADSDDWTDELLSFVANRFNMSKVIVLLFVKESSGEKAGAQQTLATIKREPQILRELLGLLTANEVLKIPSRYAGSVDTIHDVISTQISRKNFVSIESISTGLGAYFASLESSKQILLQTLVSYNVGVTESLRRQFEDNYLPSDVTIDEMIEYFSKYLRIKKEFLALFYLEFTQDEASLIKTYSEIIGNHWVSELGRLLIKLEFVEIPAHSEMEMEVQNLSSVLESFSTFKMSAIQSRYQLFSNLLVSSTTLSNFCNDNGIVPSGFKINFPSLLELLKEKSGISSYDQLYMVCNEIVSHSELRQLGEDVIRATTITALVLFFNSNADSRKVQACKVLASNDLASKILYHYIAVSEEIQLNGGKVTLRQVVQEVLTNSAITYPYLDDVRSVISEGRVPLSISDIATVRFGRQLKSVNELEQRNADVSKMFNEMKVSLRNFFGVELEKDVVLQLLKLQVVSAYLITTSTGKPVIGQIIDLLMPEICEEYARKDPKFENLLMMDTGAGYHTRIGIVPIGQSFQQFSARFAELFNAAVQKYCIDHPSESPKEFSANVIRIFPMDATFKIVVGDLSVDTFAEHPALRIRDLFLTRLSTEENLALVAAARVNDSERLALRKVITNLFDGYTSLWSLLESRISSIIGTRKQLRESFENQTFDKMFLQGLQARTMTELALKVYAESSTPKGKQELEKQILDFVSEIVRTTDSRMNEADRETLVREIQDRLYNIGMIMSSN